MMRSRINFIFNAHMPFVRHPEYPKFLEEDWLYEVMNESYLPLLRMMFKLKDDKVPFRLTFSLSPTLCSMLSDDLLNERFCAYRPFALAIFFALMFLTQDVKTRQLAIVRIVA